MAAIRSYKDLIVWQKAMDFTANVYVVARSFPSYEQAALTSQITRAAVSIPTNIAEGNGRNGAREYSHFLSIARGSLLETETLLLLTVRLGYKSESEVEDCLSLAREIDRMLCTMRRNLADRT